MNATILKFSPFRNAKQMAKKILFFNKTFTDILQFLQFATFSPDTHSWATGLL